MTLDQILENLDAAGVMALCLEIGKRRLVSLEDMWSRDRRSYQAHARHEFWAALKATDPIAWSYPRIGELSGHEHSTVMSGVRAHLIRSFKAMPASMPVDRKTEVA